MVSNNNPEFDRSNDTDEQEYVDILSAGDAHKTEKVTKLGREDMDPDEGSD